jgi:hypothetical protein
LKFSTRSARRDPFGSLGFAKRKLRRDRTFEVFKGRQEVEIILQGVKFRREDATSFGKEVLVELKMDGGIASRRSVEVPWTIGSDRPTEGLRLSVFQHP